MNIYEIGQDFDNYKFFVFKEDDESNKGVWDYNGQSLINEWKGLSLELFRDKRKKKDKRSEEFDASCYFSGCLIVNKRTSLLLSEKLKGQIEVLPVNVDGNASGYYFINVLNTVDALNIESKSNEEILKMMRDNNGIFYIEMLWLLSIGIMLDYEDDLIHGLVQLIKDREAKDYIYDTLIRYRFPDWERTTNQVLYPSPYRIAITVTELAEQDKAEAVKRLEKYLKKEWYRGHSDLSWHDDHKYGINHDGYWCFESGALVKVLGLDDSSLKGLPYYPYDMVHWNDNIK